MADDATTSTTPADQVARAYTSPDGAVDTGGKTAWVWCKDPATGGRFDIPSRALPRSGVEVVEGYPLNFKRHARRGKTRLQVAADPVEADEHGAVGEAGAPESQMSGDDAHAAAAAAASQPVEVPAPEVASSGDVQHQEVAAAAPDLADGEPVAEFTDAKAATPKIRRA